MSAQLNEKLKRQARKKEIKEAASEYVKIEVGLNSYIYLARGSFYIAENVAGSHRIHLNSDIECSAPWTIGVDEFKRLKKVLSL